ncbi:hypothetical protein SAMN05444671_4257 [Flavobacterium sp. CF108]|nr:hypothetical protein SAMN05444671_4257 [Flavobacterium sp. CF108]
MKSTDIRILLTDDDRDDRYFFAQSVKDLNFNCPVEFLKMVRY